MDRPTVTIRPGLPADAEEIASINEHWNAAYERGALSAGFLRHRFDPEQLRALATKGDVVVAVGGRAVVGYYLINSVFDSDTVRRRTALVHDLVRRGRLPEGQYAVQTQAGIAPDHQRTGLGRNLLASLKRQVQDRFDHLVGIVYDGNDSAMAAHERSGWRRVEPVPDGWLLATPTRLDAADHS